MLLLDLSTNTSHGRSLLTASHPVRANVSAEKPESAQSVSTSALVPSNTVFSLGRRTPPAPRTSTISSLIHVPNGVSGGGGGAGGVMSSSLISPRVSDRAQSEA